MTLIYWFRNYHRGPLRHARLWVTWDWNRESNFSLLRDEWGFQFRVLPLYVSWAQTPDAYLKGIHTCPASQ